MVEVDRCGEFKLVVSNRSLTADPFKQLDDIGSRPDPADGLSLVLEDPFPPEADLICGLDDPVLGLLEELVRCR